MSHAPDSVPSAAAKPGRGLRGVALGLVDHVVRQGLKRPLPTPTRLLGQLTGGRSLPDAVGDRTVLITGSSSGIGEATAVSFAAAGARVLLVARRVDELERVAARITAAGGTAFIYPCDLSDRSAIQELVTQVLSDHEVVDLVVNNAGRSIRRWIVDSFDRFHDFERTMELNYYGPVALSLGLLPAMLAQGSGQIINISTWGTQLPAPQFVAYVSSKAALDAFTRGTAAELQGTGVTLSSVHLPLVRTPMITPALEAYRGMPSLSAEEAAGLIAEAVITRASRVEPAFVTLGHVGDALSSATTDRLMGTIQRNGIGPTA